ncbi:hypothetical protein RF11_10058 [Thelohanellus kitauei]|uniref:Uncharacterized protein n=1 Tax=Thelohanellus kitauei TaxID=669202 RepID=A0A0C2MMQ9_THEKT|nr:hypothetical protein RF11_10058 [Thelohanellus kitauei]
MKLIHRFSENQEICGVTCEVLTPVIHVSNELPYDHKKVSEQLLQLYQSSGFHCYVQPFPSFIRVYQRNISGGKWFFGSCLVFQKTNRIFWNRSAIPFPIKVYAISLNFFDA